jgi:Bacterial Ig domain/Putative Ig domain
MLTRGATLTGSFAPMPSGTSVDLTAEGQLDWGYWGLITEGTYDHKYGVTQQISYAFITDTFFTDGPYQLTHASNTFSWSNGTPSRAVTNAGTGVYIFGDSLPGNTRAGFQLQCPADSTLKQLKFYVGTSGSRATFSASLSGASTYADNSFNGATGPLNGVYTLNFQASSPGQTFTVTFNSTDTSGYLILQAATLAGSDAPPTVAITAPGDGAVFTAPATFSISAMAADGDGSVTNLSLFNGANLLAQAAAGAVSLTLSNQGGNAYEFFAVATDDRGLSVTSFPAKVFVCTGSGTLLGSVATPSAAVNLTTEGRTDWAHWGLASPASFDHKRGVTQRIPNVVALNASTSAFNQYSDNFTAYSWSDGTPTTSAQNSPTGLFIYGTNDPPGGFQLTVPATNTLRWLKVYVGLYAAQGRLDARLTDFGAPPYSDSSLFAAYENGYAVYTFAFASTNAGTSLNVTWLPTAIFDVSYGNLTWQAATLAEPPLLAAISNRTIALGQTLTITNLASDPYGDPLTFTLGGGAATGASINPTNGLFTWTPTQAQLGSNAFSVVATDQGLPPLSTTQSFTVTVVQALHPAPILHIVGPFQSNQLSLTFHAEAGPQYTVLYTPSLSATNWQVLTNFAGAGADVLVVDPAIGSAQRFYRVLVQ